MMTNDGHVFFWGGGFMWIFWILIIAGIIFLFINLTKGTMNKSQGESDSPIEILKKRYARGEIDEEEYQRRRNELDG